MNNHEKNQSTLRDIYQGAQRFYENGSRELDKIVDEERFAKDAALLGAVVGTALFYGEPGGGKSTLSHNLYRIFQDVNQDSHVSSIPVDPELSPIRIAGGITYIDSTETIDGKSTSKRVAHKVEPLITADTKIIELDESNRHSTEVLNVLLEAFQNKTITTSEGIVALEGLTLITSTMNPSDTRQGTFKHSAAYASRNSVGAPMGYEYGHKTKGDLFSGTASEPEQIRPITTTTQMHLLRAFAKAIIVPDSLKSKGIEVGDRIIKQLSEDFGINEAGRIYGQLGLNTRVLSMFAGETANIEHLNKAARLLLAARIGTLISSNTVIEDLNSIHEKVAAK
jgi:hypothetical protein